jgi:hypothetical protein
VESHEHDGDTHDIIPITVFVLLAWVARVIVVCLQTPFLTYTHVLVWEGCSEAWRHITNVLSGTTIAAVAMTGGLLNKFGLGSVVSWVLAGQFTVAGESEQVSTIVKMANGADNGTVDVGGPVPVNTVLVCLEMSANISQ